MECDKEINKNCNFRKSLREMKIERLKEEELYRYYIYICIFDKIKHFEK